MLWHLHSGSLYVVISIAPTPCLKDWGTYQAYGHPHEPLACCLVPRFRIHSHNYWTVQCVTGSLFEACNDSIRCDSEPTNPTKVPWCSQQLCASKSALGQPAVMHSHQYSRVSNLK